MRKVCLFVFICCLSFPVFSQWNTDPAVNLQVASQPVSDMQSLTTSDGKTWVAYYHQNAANYDMRVQLLDKFGNKLFGNNGMLVDNKTSGSATFVFNICLDENEDLIVAYQDQRNSSNTYTTVVYKISQAGSHIWDQNGVVVGEGLAPYPAVLSNGEVVVAWSESNSNTLNIQKIDASGTVAWTNPIQVKVGTSNTTRGQLIGNVDGSFTMVFQRRGFGINTTLYAQRYNNAGAAIWASPLLLNSEATSGARYYCVRAEEDTVYCGFYSSPGSRFNSWLQRINPNGTLPYGSNGSNFSTATGFADPYQQNTRIALNPGSPYVWSVCSMSDASQGQYGVYVQKFLKSTGARQLTDFGKNVYPISSLYETQLGDMSLLNDAPFIMTSDNTNKLYATRLDANGNFVWTGNRVQMATTGNVKGRFGFTGLSNSFAVAVWSETRTANYAYAQNITPGGLFGLKVSTQGNVPATINSAGGTLQMQATVYPASANQNVIWSIVPGTGIASISTSGLITASVNGTVWAKAIAEQDSSVMDSLLITLSNQAQIPVTDITITTFGGVPATITTQGGSLQLVASVSPVNAGNTAVTWSLGQGAGQVTLSANGLVTAVSNGTIWVIATSVSNPSVADSIQVTINQVIPVVSIVVNTQGGVPAVITTQGGTLQLVANILPVNATDQRVIWSIINGNGSATISASGLVTAITNGMVYAKAVSVAYPSIQDSMMIDIQQVVPVTGIIVYTQGNIPAVITTQGGTLQMVANVTPVNATDQRVTWSIINVTGSAAISASGLVTAITDGTVYAKAVSLVNPSLMDSLLININQFIPVNDLLVRTQGGVPAFVDTIPGTLQLEAVISPSNASDPSVTWSVIPVTGNANISSTGLLTSIANGTVYAKAVSNSNPSIKDSLLITIDMAPAVNDNMLLYPNPSSGILNLYSGRPHAAMSLVLLDAAGKKLKEWRLPADALQQTFQADLQALPAGLYILHSMENPMVKHLRWVKL